MTSIEAIKTLISIVGFVLAVPALILLFHIGQFFGVLKATLVSLKETAAEFSEKVDTCLEDYGQQLADHETRLVVLERPYDGVEKRHAQRLYQGPEKRHASAPERGDETGG